MKQLTLAATAFLLTQPAAARMIDINKLEEHPEMTAFVRKVLALTGLHNDVPVLVDPKAESCGYATTKGGREYIGVNLECVGPLRVSIPYEGYNWYAVGVLTHEIGHLLGGHTANGANSHREENEADEWAAWAMYRLGASMPQARSFFSSLSREGSKSHPARAVRIASVMRGWSRARENETAPIPRSHRRTSEHARADCQTSEGQQTDHRQAPT